MLIVIVAPECIAIDTVQRARANTLPAYYKKTDCLFIQSNYAEGCGGVLFCILRADIDTESGDYVNINSEHTHALHIYADGICRGTRAQSNSKNVSRFSRLLHSGMLNVVVLFVMDL